MARKFSRKWINQKILEILNLLLRNLATKLKVKVHVKLDNNEAYLYDRLLEVVQRMFSGFNITAWKKDKVAAKKDVNKQKNPYFIRFLTHGECNWLVMTTVGKHELVRQLSLALSFAFLLKSLGECEFLVSHPSLMLCLKIALLRFSGAAP